MTLSKEALEKLRTQLRALDSGYVGVIEAHFGERYSARHIRRVLSGERNGSEILEYAVTLLERLREKQADLIARIKRTSKQAA